MAAANEILMYGEIGENWWAEDGGITALGTIEKLEAFASDATVAVRINSPGGDAFEGIAIHNALARASQRIIVHVDGTALSAASIIAMAGDEVRMAENALMMIHDPWTFAIGDAAEMRKVAGMLDNAAGSLAQTYATQTGKELSDVRDLMIEETWFTASQALDEGFATHVDAPQKQATATLTGAHVKAFRHAPAEVLQWISGAGVSRSADMRVAAMSRQAASAEPENTVDESVDVPSDGASFAINLPKAGTATTIAFRFNQDPPPADERGGDHPHTGDTMSKEIQAALDTATAELTTVKARAEALDVQNKALVTERDEALAKLQTIEDEALQAHVKSLVGVKFSGHEYDAQLALARSDRAMFDKLAEQRTPMTLLKRDPANMGPDPQPKPASGGNDNGAGLAAVVVAAANANL